jgi:16S rRNA (cytosine1402-N4)-methyltransferase
MLREVVEYLNPKPGKRYLDGTMGGGGHSEQILIESEPDGLVLGLDRDDEALSAARQAQRFGARLKRVRRVLLRRAKFLRQSAGRWSME